MNGKRRIVVVGGGLAGLSAAAYAARAGHRVTVLEKAQALPRRAGRRGARGAGRGGARGAAAFVGVLASPKLTGVREIV